jgi:hypothetical protein
LNYDEIFVGLLAIFFACVATGISVGPWDAPYRLRTIAMVTDRFGKPAARSVWLVIALASLAAGIAIISGTRPAYATQSQQAPVDS